MEALATADSVEKDRDRWEQIALMVAAGEMPPLGMPRPDAPSVQAITNWLKLEFHRQDKMIKPDSGRVVARRLNRAEYNNTIRDLLGVGLRPADDFPQDDSGYGFDNIGAVLSLSPALMEKYLSAAEKVSRAALFADRVPKPALDHYQPHLRRPPPPKDLFKYDETGLALPSAINKLHQFPVDGEYLLKFVLNGQQPEGSEPRTVAVWIDGKQVKLFEIENTVIEGQSRQFRTSITKGEHLVSVSYLRYFEGLPAMYGGPNPSKKATPLARARNGNTPGAAGTAVPVSGGPASTADAADAPLVPVPLAVGALTSRVEALDIGGPFDAKPLLPTESRRLIFACGHAEKNHNADCPRKTLSNLARRAYRRPVTAQEVDSLLKLYGNIRGKGGSFDEGISVAIQYILISPDFLFRIATDAQPQAIPSPVSQYEMASRLSYFLWSSMPDDRLFQLAGEGKLHTTDQLNAEVDRMLANPKSKAIVENFAGQWLQLRDLDALSPDPIKFATFDAKLRRSMRQETELLFNSILRENRSILELLSADYTYLDERLARHYDIGGISGDEFRRVDLQGKRRGMLMHGSILLLTSNPTRTSPVKRGKWVLENLLAEPPPPPPPNVPELGAEGETLGTLRQQMEQHRTNPNCAVCHVKMDAVGFGLENFDAIGSWRESDGRERIDPSGILPGGRNFNGPLDLVQILVEDKKTEFTRCVTLKMLTYALGRGLGVADRCSVSSIVKKLAEENYRFVILIKSIVTSPPFTHQESGR